MSGEESVNGLSGVVSALADELIPVVAGRLGVSAPSLQSRFEGVRLVRNLDLNGCCRSSSDWRTFEIVLNRGLLLSFGELVKLFAKTFIISGETAHGSDMPFEDTTEVAGRVMDAFWKNQLPTTSGFDGLELSNDQISVSSFLLNYMESFVVAQGFGHAILRLSPDRRAELRLGTGFARDNLKKIPNQQSHQVECWGEEFAADLLALSLVLDLGEGRAALTLKYAAIECVFVNLNLLEQYERKKALGLHRRSSHPPSVLRLQNVREMMEKEGGASSFDIGIAMEQMANQILKAV